MKIFLTGGRGMVGRNILEHPLAANYQIISPTSEELNLLSGNEVSAYLKSELPDIVIHCAGVVGGIQANLKNPVKYFSDNMLMGLNVINGSREAGVLKLLNMGSSCMYPRNGVNPLREESILTGELEPTNEGYALAKISSARLTEYIIREDPRFEYKTIIPCNLYGKYDKFEESHSHMIPAVIAKIDDAVKRGAKEIDIWGDGSARREFMYAGDLADFIFMSLSRFDEIPSLVNVGVGYDYSINEYYEMIARIESFKGKFVHDLSKPVGMKQKVVDIQKINALGWKAKTSLEEGIRETYQYYIEQVKL